MTCLSCGIDQNQTDLHSDCIDFGKDTGTLFEIGDLFHARIDHQKTPLETLEWQSWIQRP